MHAVYNYSGFADLVSNFDPSRTRADTDCRGAQERRNGEKSERSGEAVVTLVPTIDAT
jgi:hypothetical protein